WRLVCNHRGFSCANVDCPTRTSRGRDYRADRCAAFYLFAQAKLIVGTGLGGRLSLLSRSNCRETTEGRLNNRMLEAKDVVMKYGELVAVDRVSLVLKPGEITSIIGPNGAGKSTLLRALNGFLHTNSGTVTLDNQPLDRFSRRTIGRHIAVVAQEAELRFPITVLEFVLGGRYAWVTNSAWGWETERDLGVVEAVLAETELSQLSGRLMNQLSGGERQRAVLARALATEAQILLLDEPTANLDLSHQSSLLAVVRGRCNKQNVAALFVTYD